MCYLIYDFGAVCHIPNSGSGRYTVLPTLYFAFANYINMEPCDYVPQALLVYIYRNHQCNPNINPVTIATNDKPTYISYQPTSDGNIQYQHSKCDRTCIDN